MRTKLTSEFGNNSEFMKLIMFGSHDGFLIPSKYHLKNIKVNLNTMMKQRRELIGVNINTVS